MEEQITAGGASAAAQPQNQNYIHTNVIMEAPKSNPIGTTGFVFAILNIFLGWIPVVGWIIWFLGALLSFIGVFKRPKGLAIAGLIISFIGLILIFTLGAVILAAAGLS